MPAVRLDKVIIIIAGLLIPAIIKTSLPMECGIEKQKDPTLQEGKDWVPKSVSKVLSPRL